MKLLLLSFLLAATVLLSSLTPSTISAATKKPRRYVVTRLIHRDSIFSPYYNPNATIEERAREVQERSIARLRYLASSFAHTDDVRAHVIAEDFASIFLVKLSIGEPPVEQLLAMDTGSNLIWVQCQPCINCFVQYSAYFDPSKSSTYQNLTCNSTYCPKDSCDFYRYCSFSYGYADPKFSATGVLATEKFSGFFTSDEGITSIPSVIFGCAYDNKGEDGQLSGILGLAAHNVISTLLGPKFSYCIGNISDPKYSHNLLVLGDGAIIQGDSTPLEVFNYHYYLTMESISVGDKGLNIDPKVFQKDPKGAGGVVIDSGSTLSYLLEDAHRLLREEVRGLLDGKLKRLDDPKYPSMVCYKGDINRDLTGFPVVTFHFAGGAELGLDIGSFFRQVTSSQFCMAVHLSPPELNGLNIVGVMAQQNHNVAYDLDGKKLTIENIDCQLLES